MQPDYSTDALGPSAIGKVAQASLALNIAVNLRASMRKVLES